MIAKHFTLDDQKAFAAFSGDSNPLHIDPLIARRSQFGLPIVHGIHLVLWGLEQALNKSQKVSLASICCIMRIPVRINETVTYRVVEQTDEGLKLAIDNHGAECISLTVALSSSRAPYTISKHNPVQTPCHERTEDQLADTSGTVALAINQQSLNTLFPGLAHVLPIDQIACIATTTRLVGMDCPGLYSIFSELHLNFNNTETENNGVLVWVVDNYDDRFHRIQMSLLGTGVKGSIIAMLRPKPQKQTSTAELKRRLPQNGIFKNQRSLVIGGSRGIGELCAKLLAAGSADVRITYNSGKEDALAVAEDICQHGGEASVLPYDILAPPINLQTQLGEGWLPTHIYYFPTPPIFAATRNKFAFDLFTNFCRYYVDGFHGCWNAIRNLTTDKFVMFYPSSVAVEDIYTNMGEYAAAKAAGESLCKFLETSDRALKIKIARLPRLASDQTLSLIETDVEDATAVILKEIINL